MWEILLYLVADGDNIRPRQVEANGAICDTGLRCDPIRFDDQDSCRIFVHENGRAWHRETGAAVVATCVLVDRSKPIS